MSDTLVPAVAQVHETTACKHQLPSQAVADARSQKQRMLEGELFDALDAELVIERQKASRLQQQLNQSDSPLELHERLAVLKQLVGGIDESAPPFISTPFLCDYGYNIHLGAGVVMNPGCCILDGTTVRIGARTIFAPKVQLYGISHPLDPTVRRAFKGIQYARPITIGSDCQIGGSSIIMGGVSIGDRAVLQAGAVVTRDVPSGAVVAGNPARVL